MEIIGCGKGHYYNPELYSSCPECAKAGGNADVLGVTEPVDFGKYANNNFSPIGATEPVDFDSFASSNSSNASPVVGSFGDMMSTTDFKTPGGMETTPVSLGTPGGAGTPGSKVQDYGATMPVTPLTTGSVPFQPVVGWLVCIDGPAKGRDYRVHSQYNYIGRGQHMDICISGDDCISTERAAVIAYDSEEKFFSFGPSMGHNVVRVNGKMLMNAVVLNAYDELTIGKTKLLFVPLCGERFDWNEK